MFLDRLKCAALSLCLFFVFNLTYAQDPNENPGLEALLGDVITASPEFSDFQILSPQDIDYFNGIPNINIPLYSMGDGGISFPISLSYNASGVKVQSVPSVVGTNWSISNVYRISREVRGLPDNFNGISFDPTAAYSDPTAATSVLNEHIESHRFWIDRVINGTADGEPDLFHISLPTVNCSFFIDKNGEFRTIPATEVKIETEMESGMRLWTITDASGNVYHLGSDAIGNEITEKTTPISSTNVTPTETSWYLGWCQPYLSSGTINFEYNHYLYDGLHGMSESKGFAGQASECRNQVSILRHHPWGSQYDSKLVKRITTSMESLEFSYSDLGVFGRRKLNHIEHTNRNGELVNRIELEIDWYNSQCGKTRLNSVQRIAPSGVSMPPYVFDYVDSHLVPDRFHKGVDDYGYFNGNTNSTLIPDYFLGEEFFPGANRAVNENKLQVGTLKSIDYPTGARREFLYERNQVELASPISMTDEAYHPMPFGSGTAHGTNGNDYSISFDVNAALGSTAPIPVRVALQGSYPGQMDPNFTFVAIEDALGNSVYSSIVMFNSQIHTDGFETVIYLNPGQYSMNVDYNGGAEGMFSVRFDNPMIGEIQTHKYSGGLRLQEVRDLDNGQEVRSRCLEYDNGVGASDVVYFKSMNYALSIQS